MGRLLLARRGVAPDSVEAARWIRQAAEQGHARAQYWLGRLYLDFENRGLTPNSTAAAEWFRRAAEQGHSGAEYRLGRLLLAGRGVAPDSVEAARWIRQAAEQGHARAQYWLGRLYLDFEDRGLTPNRTAAAEWFRRAAEQGHVGARSRLGELAAFGQRSDQDRTAGMERLRPTATSTPKISEAVAPTREGATPASSIGGSYRIWLTSLPSQQLAQQSKRELLESYPAILQDLELSITPVDLGAGKGIWYRVEAGPIESRASAAAACVAIQETTPGSDCFIRAR